MMRVFGQRLDTQQRSADGQKAAGARADDQRRKVAGIGQFAASARAVVDRATHRCRHLRMKPP